MFRLHISKTKIAIPKAFKHFFFDLLCKKTTIGSVILTQLPLQVLQVWNNGFNMRLPKYKYPEFYSILNPGSIYPERAFMLFPTLILYWSLYHTISKLVRIYIFLTQVRISDFQYSLGSCSAIRFFNFANSFQGGYTQGGDPVTSELTTFFAFFYGKDNFFKWKRYFFLDPTSEIVPKCISVFLCLKIGLPKGMY